ncbi:hypothetical protein, partial [Parabacteroides sp.]
GRLFFTDENVSSTEKNVLTDNKWKAVDAKIAADGSAFGSGNDVLYLTNGKEHKRVIAPATTETTQKEYLLVDYSFYDPSEDFNKLIVDTIAVEPDATSPAAFNTRLAAKHHSATAAFKVTYYIPNDSMVIAPQFTQTKIAVATTLNGKYANIYATYNSSVSTYTNEVQEIYNAICCVGEGVKTYAAASPKLADKFASDDNKYAVSGASGSAVSGNDLIKRVTDAIAAVKYSSTAATKKLEEGLVAAAKAYLKDIEDLTWVKQNVVTTKVFEGPSYVDGLNPLTVDAVSPAKQVVIRKLSNTKVLTIGQIEGANGATDMHGNLIATIKTSDKDATIGGDATIAEGLYYVIDAEKEASAGVANKYYGLYFDKSPVNAAKYVAKAQAFNPYAQFVVSKAAGVDKGNYTIENRATADAEWQGVTNVVDKDKNIFAIGSDTIQLVAAEDVDAD